MKLESIPLPTIKDPDDFHSTEKEVENHALRETLKLKDSLFKQHIDTILVYHRFEPLYEYKFNWFTDTLWSGEGKILEGFTTDEKINFNTRVEVLKDENSDYQLTNDVFDTHSSSVILNIRITRRFIFNESYYVFGLIGTKKNNFYAVMYKYDLDSNFIISQVYKVPKR